MDGRRSGKTILILFLIGAGFVARLALLWAAGRAPAGPLSGGSDAPAYILLGHAVALGKGLTYVGQATALRAPLYPLMLASLDLVFGSWSLLIMRIVQVVAAILTAWVCAQTAVQLWGEDSKWTVFGLAMFMPTLLFFTPQILTETFTALLVSLFLYFLVRVDGEVDQKVDRKEEWKSLVATGACAGVSMLLRSNTLFLPFVAAASALRMPVGWKNIKRGIVPVAIAALIVSPWIVRNLVVFHGGVVYSSLSGIATLDGALAPQGRTQPGEESEVWKRAGWALADIETDSPRRLQFASEADLNRRARHEAVRAWSALEFHIVPLLAKKVSYFWLGTDQLLATGSFPIGQRILRAGGVLFYWGILGLAIAEWFRLRKAAPRTAYVLLFYCVAATMLHLPVTMNTRLRVPLVDPLLCVLAGGAISAAFANERG